MSDEMKKGSQELNDNELEHVNGGYNYFRVSYDHDSFYLKYTGSEADRDSKYLCPKCGRPVHAGKNWSYYCDPCNDFWLNENKLIPNVAGGLWTRVDSEDLPWYGGFIGKTVDSYDELRRIMNW